MPLREGEIGGRPQDEQQVGQQVRVALNAVDNATLAAEKRHVLLPFAPPGDYRTRPLVYG